MCELQIKSILRIAPYILSIVLILLRLCTFFFFIYVHIEHFQSAADAIRLSLSWLRAELSLLLLLLHRLNHHLTRCLIRELIWKSAFEDGREIRNKT